jgi:hypothetical protein
MHGLGSNGRSDGKGVVIRDVRPSKNDPPCPPAMFRSPGTLVALPPAVSFSPPVLLSASPQAVFSSPATKLPNAARQHLARTAAIFSEGNLSQRTHVKQDDFGFRFQGIQTRGFVDPLLNPLPGNFQSTILTTPKAV